MKQKSGNSGFTMLELLIVMAMVGCVVFGFGLIGGVVMGNYWVGNDSALSAIQVVDPSMVKVNHLERHVWGYSKAYATDDNGNRREFYLDACILQNVSAIPAEPLASDFKK